MKVPQWSDATTTTTATAAAVGEMTRHDYYIYGAIGADDMRS